MLLWARRGFTSQLQAVCVDSLCKHSLTQTKITTASPFIKNVRYCVRRLLALRPSVSQRLYAVTVGDSYRSSIDINNAVNHLDLRL